MTARTPQAPGRLTADHAAVVERARAVLTEDSPSMYELGDMAARIGRLEWHVGELLALISDLTAKASAPDRR
jgi:hypothetical protein